MKIYSAVSEQDYEDDETNSPVYFTTLKKAWAWKVNDLRESFKQQKAEAIESKQDFIRNYCHEDEIPEAKGALARIKARKFALDWTIECEPGNMIDEHDVKPGLRSFVEFLNNQVGGPGQDD
jgi:hypothetical protein